MTVSAKYLKQLKIHNEKHYKKIKVEMKENRREQEKVVMPVYKPQSLTKLLKVRCKFGSFLPGSQGKKGNVMNFMVCLFLKEKRCLVFKGRGIFSSTQD